MSEHTERFFSIVGCMDGRSMAAFVHYGDENGGMYPDVLLEGPGIVAVLADPLHSEHEAAKAKMRKQMAVSYGKHASAFTIVAGHPSCAGHPVEDASHKQTVLDATRVVREVAAEVGYPDHKVMSAWNAPADGVWKVRMLDESDAEGTSDQIAA